MKLNFKLSIVSISVFIFILNLGCSENKANSKEFISPSDSVTTVTLTFVGDIMCHSTQYKAASTKDGLYDFSASFENIKPIIQSSDFSIGNLETVFAGIKRGFSGYPRFNSPDEYLSAIKGAGFKYLTTANNHALDMGEDGVYKTIKLLDSLKIDHAGTYTSEADYDSIRVFNVKGIKLAILPYSYGTNGMPIPKGKNFIISLINKERIINQIKAAKKLNVDLVIVHFHYGQEYTLLPNNTEKELVKLSIDNGADIIIGGHPHVLQPTDTFVPKSSKLDKGFIAYSMGNFISGQTKRYTDESKIIKLTLKKDFSTNKLNLIEIKEFPTKVIRNTKGEYIINVVGNN